MIVGTKLRLNSVDWAEKRVQKTLVVNGSRQLQEKLLLLDGRIISNVLIVSYCYIVYLVDKPNHPYLIRGTDLCCIGPVSD